MVKWSLQLPTWKNYFKAITKNISYTVESQEKSYYYLVDCHEIAKEVCDKLDLDFIISTRQSSRTVTTK